MLNKMVVIALLAFGAFGCEPKSSSHPAPSNPPGVVQAVIPSAIDAAAPGAARAVSAEEIKQAQEAAADSPQHE